MMFSSCKPFGTNCNFLNGVRSSCHEHFKSCYKYIFLNNFTFKGVSFLQSFLTMCFSQFFFYQALELKTVPYLFLLREWFYYVIEKWLHSPSLYPLKSQGARSHPPLNSGGAKANGFWMTDWNLVIHSVPEFQDRNVPQHQSSQIRIASLSSIRKLYDGRCPWTREFGPKCDDLWWMSMQW